MIAPIAIFVYKRIDETKKTIEAIKANYLASESELFIFSDNAKNEAEQLKVDLVRNFIRQITGFKKITIYENEINKGLAKSIISGVTLILESYTNVIILEDDLVVTPNFLDFMNASLKFYENEKNIYSVNGFSLKLPINKETEKIYFQKRPFSWGWATWKNRWNSEIFDKSSIEKELFNDKNLIKNFNKECGNDIGNMLLSSLNGKIDSWYVFWVFFHFKNNVFSVYPYRSLITNNGYSIDSTNCKTINPYISELDNGIERVIVLPEFLTPTKKTIKPFLNYFSKMHRIIIRLKLLKNISGLKLLIEDIKLKRNRY